jgi:hypothetical protein
METKRALEYLMTLVPHSRAWDLGSDKNWRAPLPVLNFERTLSAHTIVLGKNLLPLAIVMP